MQTRQDVRLAKFIDAREELLSKLLALFESRTQRIDSVFMRHIGEHIRDIGKLSPTDVHRLEQYRRMNANVKDIEARIAAMLENGEEDLLKALAETAKIDARISAIQFGTDYKTVTENVALTRILKALYKETGGSFTNLSNTSVVNSAYRAAVDEAVSLIRAGTDDYGSAIRRSLRNASSFGLRVRDKDNAQVVDYTSGRSRRLDSAVRMNILDGMRHVNQTVMDKVGEEFGADGVEIDAHMLCADDHLPYQGKQYSNKAFEQIQDSLKRPFGEWNCRHTWSPILLGISQPRYDGGRLAEMQSYSQENVEIDGTVHTRYEWSQVQRQLETKVRQQKDTVIAARAANDSTLVAHCKSVIADINKRYDRISDASGLNAEYVREYVQGAE